MTSNSPFFRSIDAILEYGKGDISAKQLRAKLKKYNTYNDEIKKELRVIQYDLGLKFNKQRK